MILIKATEEVHFWDNFCPPSLCRVRCDESGVVSLASRRAVTG